VNGTRNLSLQENLPELNVSLLCSLILVSCVFFKMRLNLILLSALLLLAAGCKTMSKNSMEARIPRVPRESLNHKVMVDTKDGPVRRQMETGMGWTHYFRVKDGNHFPVVDYWPDIFRAPAADLAETPLHSPNGTPAKVPRLTVRAL